MRRAPGPLSTARGVPDLSVVIVSFDSAAYLEACLASVRGAGRELIVVDNASSDASCDLVRRRFPRAILLENERNLGFARAANRGLARARGRHVLFLNPDARANAEALAAASAVLDERPQVGLVAVAVRDEAGALVPTVEPFFSLRSVVRARAARRASAPVAAEPVEIDWCHGAFLLGRREELLALGGFDERYFLYAEDMDLCHRMQESRRAVVYLPWVSIVHRGNASGEVLLGDLRPAAILASQLAFHARTRGAAEAIALRALAAGYFGWRALVSRVRDPARVATDRALLRVAIRGPAASPLPQPGADVEPARLGRAAAAALPASGREKRDAPLAPAGARAAEAPVPEAGARPAVTLAVLARADEPALEATLASLDRAAGALVARGHRVAYAICVNGATGEGALSDAERFAAGAAAGPVTVVREPRADKARAWNLARAVCDTAWVAFCDADVEVAPDALVRLADALDAAPHAALASARQVPATRGASIVARAAALPYRFDFGVVGGRLYLMRADAVARMPEKLLLEDGWLSARLGPERLLTVGAAEVGFRPPATLADYFRERLRTEAGKVQIRAARLAAGERPAPIAQYRWRDLGRGLRVRDWPLAAINLGVRLVARGAAELAHRRGREVPWRPIASSKPPRAAGGKA